MKALPEQHRARQRGTESQRERELTLYVCVCMYVFSVSHYLCMYFRILHIYGYTSANLPTIYTVVKFALSKPMQFFPCGLSTLDDAYHRHCSLVECFPIRLHYLGQWFPTCATCTTSGTRRPPRWYESTFGLMNDF